MEDFCDRIPGQHTGRLSLEHQAREAADWQQKVDDLQKQLDSANRIIRIKDESISLLEKRCNNLREELDELSDRVAVLHDRIIEQNNAIRNAVKASPAAGESDLRKLAPGDHVDSMPAVGESAPTSPEVPQAHGLTTPATPSAAEVFCKALGADSSWSWSWHCNIAMSLYDHGMSHEKANRCAADLMLHLFVIDVTSFDEWKSFPWATPSAAVGADGPGAVHTEWCDGAKEFCERQVESDTVPRAEYDRVVKLNHHLREAAVMAISERVPSDSKPTNFHNPESEDTPPHNPVLGPIVGTATVKHQTSCPAATAPTVPPEVGKRYVCRNGVVTPLMKSDTLTGRNQPYYFCDIDGTTTYWGHDGRGYVGRQDDLIAEYREPSPPSESPDVSGEIRGLKYALEWIYVKRAGNPHLKAAALEMLNDMQVAYEAAVDRLQDGEAINSTSQIDLPAESPDDWVTLTDPDHVIRKCDQISDYGTQWYGPSDLTAALGKQYKNCGFKLVRCLRKDLPPEPVVPKTRTVTLREYRLGVSSATHWTTSDTYNAWTTGRTCECEVPE